MYLNASKITVSDLEEELNKRNMKIVAEDGNISSIQQEDDNVETTGQNGFWWRVSCRSYGLK